MEVLKRKCSLLMFFLFFGFYFACLNAKPKFENVSDPFNLVSFLLKNVINSSTNPGQLAGSKETVTLLPSGKSLNYRWK